MKNWSWRWMWLIVAAVVALYAVSDYYFTIAEHGLLAEAWSRGNVPRWPESEAIRIRDGYVAVQLATLRLKIACAATAVCLGIYAWPSLTRRHAQQA